MSTFLIAFAAVLCLLLCSTIWCCLAISSAARDVEPEDKPVSIGDYWTLHRNGDYCIIVAELRGQTFAWSYRLGQEQQVGNVLVAWEFKGLITGDEALAIWELVSRSSLVKEAV